MESLPLRKGMNVILVEHFCEDFKNFCIRVSLYAVFLNILQYIQFKSLQTGGMDLDALILSYIIDIWYIDTLDYNVLPK